MKPSKKAFVWSSTPRLKRHCVIMLGSEGGGREEGREGGKEGGREGRREGGREGKKEKKGREERGGGWEEKKED